MVKTEELAALVAHEIGDEAVKVGTPESAVAGVVPSVCLLYTSPSPRDATLSRMPSSA